MSKPEGSFFRRLQASPQGACLKLSCGGEGICGGCKVRVLKEPPLPTARDRSLITPEELRKGVRLACALPDDFAGEFEVEAGEGIQTAFPLGELSPDIHFPLENNLLAIDLGTTTIAMVLFSGEDGHVLSSWQGVNAQRAFGADVISRLKAAEEGHSRELKHLICTQLLEGISYCLKEHDAEVYLAGNTPMLHLLLGYPVESLSRGRCIAFSLDAAQEILGDIPVHVLPGFSTFVGADILAGMHQVEPWPDFLFLDLGTNTEMVISSQWSFLGISAPGGPAFESFAPAGIYAADLVKALAMLLKEGKMDSTGLLKEPFFSKGAELVLREKAFTLHQKDIRELQKAKAAVAAGIELLIRQRGMPERLYLAGGFGLFLEPSDAELIGLFPPGFGGEYIRLGNAVLTGILRYYADHGKQVEGLRKVMRTELLTGFPDFTKAYIRHMEFGQTQWFS